MEQKREKAMEQAVVDVNDLSRSFGDKIALDRVSFRATAGQVYGLVGSNGAGKTTLLKHLLGLLRATTGSVRVFGLDPVRDPVGVLSRVGYLSEEHELPEWMRIDELMRYTQAYHPTSWDASYARELLVTFGLDPAKKVKELSKGMRAQAGLIAAVAHRPELLILDEPSSGLDAVVRRDILDAIVRTVADDGRTVIFSSHLLDEVERMSDHVTLIHQGRVALSGVLDDVRGSYQRSRVHFVDHLDKPPVLDTALAVEGGGRAWSVIHSGSLEQFRHSVAARGGEVVDSRNATLEEIFLARAGRGQPQVEAA
jgi:ABC-2 type transport system ATP-binding protein